MSDKITVRSLLSDTKIKITDLHSDSVDGFRLFQKICPSSVRLKIIERANKNKTSELMEIIDTLIKYQDMEKIYPSALKRLYIESKKKMEDKSKDE